MSKYFSNILMAANNSNEVIYQLQSKQQQQQQQPKQQKQQVVVTSVPENSNSLTMNSAAVRKLSYENVKNSARIFITTGEQHLRPLQTTAIITNAAATTTAVQCGMATHLLDHGYGVSVLPSSSASTSVLPPKNPSLSTAIVQYQDIDLANTSCSVQNPASQQKSHLQIQSQHPKFKSTDMTQYYKVITRIQINFILK